MNQGLSAFIIYSDSFSSIFVGAFRAKHNTLFNQPIQSFTEVSGNMGDLCPNLVAAVLTAKFEVSLQIIIHNFFLIFKFCFFHIIRCLYLRCKRI